MNLEKFTGSLRQTEKYGIKYNCNTPEKKHWYRYDTSKDTISFFDQGDYIVSFENDPGLVFFIPRNDIEFVSEK